MGELNPLVSSALWVDHNGKSHQIFLVSTWRLNIVDAAVAQKKKKNIVDATSRLGSTMVRLACNYMGLGIRISGES